MLQTSYFSEDIDEEDGFIVPHGYLSDDEGAEGEVGRRYANIIIVFMCYQDAEGVVKIRDADAAALPTVP